MTAVQRRSALRRLRLSARMGHCPRLPAAQLAFALFTDRIRTGIRRAGAAPATTPAQSGSGPGSSSGSQSSGVCVNVGPLGVCLNI
jgi:hypothetical protein